jgi:hypothetical protein
VFGLHRAQLLGREADALIRIAPPERSGQWQVTVPIALNRRGTPAVYTFAATVTDAFGNVARAGPITTTVAGRAAQLPVMTGP